jgi:hypothetical protein
MGVHPHRASGNKLDMSQLDGEGLSCASSMTSSAQKAFGSRVGVLNHPPGDLVAASDVPFDSEDCSLSVCQRMYGQVTDH